MPVASLVPSPAALQPILPSGTGGTSKWVVPFRIKSASESRIIKTWDQTPGAQSVHARFPFSQIPSWSVLIELSSEDTTTALEGILEEVVGAALERGEVIDAVIATSEQQAAEFWHIRHSVSEANKKEGIGIVHDVAVRTSDVALFIEAADAVVAQRYPQAVAQVISHLGDGNVHYILMFQRAFWATLSDQDAFALEVERIIHDVAVQFDGTFSAEHGVGRNLTGELERLAAPLRFELMSKVKTLFDPQNLLNPGVLLALKSA
uniref:FAD-binding oxidoreductase/transferase type 4 C-terminal domain-containing protein n=1 Tax=Bosea sp. NBC_00436 TaxID=2969620 RepID=A0A9E8A9Q4_9HYPH